MVALRWADGVVNCPRCGSVKIYALRTMVETRLEGMAASMTNMIGGVRAEIASKIAAEGGHDLEQSLQEVHQRVAL